ncbi:MAG: hypothetical protein AABY15_09780 [Nanoarchaeota archaeon]
MGHNHSSHMWLMAIACGGALLLILVLPFLGISKNWSFGIAITVMVGLHLLMMRDHSGHGNHGKEEMKSVERGLHH